MAQFDPEEKDLWYFGLLSRQETNEILDNEKDSGVFLVRDSTSMEGDLVLCVREDSRVSHYIINKITNAGVTRFRIGDQEFPDVPSLLSFYKTHYLDTTPLIRVAPKEQVVAKFDFAGKDAEDLPFKKGEILTVISKDEDQWWTALNFEGRKGSIPVPYVVKYGSQDHEKMKNMKQEQTIYKRPEQTNPPPVSQNTQRKLPAMAKVIQGRVPSAYDKTLLKLEIGDIVKVIETPINGQWKGIINGKEGFFPFTHIKFIEEDSESTDN